jgi:hypothetical protein
MARPVPYLVHMRRCSLIQNRSRLEWLAARLIDRVVTVDPGIEEGVVMTLEKTPYRRLDFGGRALCYIRVRPSKKVVRIDLPWPIQQCLLVASEEEVEGVAQKVVAFARKIN